MKRFQTVVILIVIVLAAITGCKKEETGNIDTGFTHGVYITNEGAFQSGNGSISWFSSDSGKVMNNVFEMVNGRSPGDLVQSFGICGDKGFIVVNGSKKVEVVDMYNFLSIGVIENISYPRYLIKTGPGQAYLSNGNMAGTVYIINTDNLAIVDSVMVGKGPEMMVKAGGYVYVANSGGWLEDNTVSVIDINTHDLITSIEVGDRPTDMVVDANGNIWVLCRGTQIYNSDWSEILEETDTKLQKINVSDNRVEKSFNLGLTGDTNPVIRHLSICSEGKIILYDESDGIYSFGINDNNISTKPLINRVFYGMEADPVNDIIYCFHVKDYVSDGYMFRYDLQGELIDSLKVGIGPSGANYN